MTTTPVSTDEPLAKLPLPLPEAVGEQVWIEVIQQMDNIYIDLVTNQLELERKNLTLEETFNRLKQAHEELQTTQQQLIQAEKMASLGRLVAGVAHELNNPISFILGNMHALSRYAGRLHQFFHDVDALHDPRIEALKKRHRVDRVMTDLDPLVAGTLEGGERVNDIVDALLRFTKPQQQSATRFDGVQLVRTAADWVLRATTNTPMVNFHMPERLSLCSFEGPVHQILVNLLQNAVDAVDRAQSPTLWIALHANAEQPSSIELTIRDNGPGIDPDHIAKVFDPFFTTKCVGKGTGLGLYISYLLATEQCGGSLTAENHPAGGALFRLCLPNQGGGSP